MRVALIGDVHANLPALLAVLEHARRHRACEVWGVGDWVGDGPFPDEVVHLLQQCEVKAVSGNYDRSVLRVEEKRAEWGSEGTPENWQAAAWTYDRLSADAREYLRSLPTEMRLEMAGRRALLTHISPSSADESIAPDTPSGRLREWARMVAADVVVVGHTHVPLARKEGGVWFINTGSVGRPKDGRPGACYAILTLGTKRVQVQHYRVDYDLEDAKPANRPILTRKQGGVPGTRDVVLLAGQPPHGGEPSRPGQAQKEPDAPPGAPPVTMEVPGDDRLQAVLQLARSCEYEEGHTHQVTRLALRLFDELKLVHGLGPRERHWLECGALLHDIGLIEGVQGHHKASLRIILDTPLLPFDKKERLIIGSIARYHRAALPQERHRHFAALKPGLRRTVRILAAILRVADGLDYTHQSLVEDLSCVLSAQEILVRCAVHGPAEEERLRALEKGDLLREVFQRDLRIEWVQ